ncbi:MAG: sugar ABC transporter substrate-binding protein [Dehalococcoidia bacterium]
MLYSFRHMRGRLAVSALVVAAVVLLTGSVAGGAPSQNPPRLKGKTIAYIQAGSVLFYQSLGDGVRGSVKQLGGKTITFDSRFDAQTEIRNVQDAITRKVDGIILTSISKTTLLTSARLAKRANIPVVNYYGYLPGITPKNLVLAYVAADATTWGTMVGQIMRGYLKKCDGCQVAEVIGLTGRGEVEAAQVAWQIQMREAGYNIVAEPTSHWVRQEAFDRTLEIMQRFPNLRGLHVGDEDTAAGSIQALKQVGKKPGDVVVTSVYASPEGLRLMREGWLQGTAGFSPPQQGVMGVRLLAMRLAGQKVNVPVPCQAPIVRVVPSNMNKVKVSWVAKPALVRLWLKQGCSNQASSG